MTTVRRGASIGRAVTAGSRGEIEAEGDRERPQRAARVGPIPPELEEAVLSRPVAVPDVEAPGVLDERDHPGDTPSRRLLGDRIEGLRSEERRVGKEGRSRW